MRRGLASLIIGMSLLVATMSWAGFTLSRTVLDPGRSERLADQLLENPDVRAALTSRLADALEAQIPADVPVPRQAVEAGAATALDDPRVEALIRDGFVRVHQNALAGNDEPVTLDPGALGAAGRDALVASRPELDPFLPAAPPVALELPTTGLAWLGTVKNVVDRFTLLGAVVAVFGGIAAFVVARDRGPVLRRVAFWGYGASAFWLLAGYGVPWLAGNLSPTSAAIATAAVDVFFGAMIAPAVVIAALSTVMLAAGLVWPTAARSRGARVAQPRRPRTPAPVTSRPIAAPAPTSTRPTGYGAAPAAVRPGAGPEPRSRPAHYGTGYEPERRQGRWQPVGSTDSTDPMPLPVARGDSRPQPSGSIAWREGYGYLDDGPVEDAFGERRPDPGERSDRTW